MAAARRFLGTVLGIAFWASAAGPAAAQQQRLPADLQQRVNQAIADGANFLKATQNPWGTWTVESHALGYAALGGLTLLESDVPADDPAVQAAAKFVRLHCVNCDKTYELALSVLFLEKLGDPNDRKKIEALAVRLIAGQTPTGGWTYRCPILTTAHHNALLKALRARPLKLSKVALPVRGLPVLQDPATLVAVDPPNRLQTATWGTTDNSNTQFAMLAIWAARRQGVPVERSLRLMVHRFETNQNWDGTWPYHYRFGGGLPERPAMNCVGLLGLAIGHGMAQDEAPRKTPIEALAAGVLGLPEPGPALLALEGVAKELGHREAVKKGDQDPRVIRGFVALGRHIGRPAERMANLPMKNLYFLWSVERVGVLYDLPTIGGKDWYRWGAEILVANQKPDGHWEGGLYPGSTAPIDTCLALLFLKRANLASDLTPMLPFNPQDLARNITEKASAAPDLVMTGKNTPESARMAAPVAPAVPALMTPVAATRAPDMPVAVTAPPAADLTAAEEGGGKLLVLLLGLLGLLLLVGGLLVLLLMRSREDEEEAPRSRKAKSARLRVSS
jgi:hypothetical protein